MTINKVCKYCLKPLNEEGFCSRPCKLGALIKKNAELKKQKTEEQKAEKTTNYSWLSNH